MNITMSLLLAPFIGRKRVYRNILAQVAAMRTTPTEHEEVCRRLTKRWNLNWENGSRRSDLVDYEYLIGIANEWLATCSSPYGVKFADRICDLARELIVMTNDGANYRVDGRMMPRESARRYAERLNELRALVRSAGEVARSEGPTGGTGL